ncbi:MAG TPA: COX15/CtaA family protein [Bryobacteraceae bacterium]|jgi:cytochrome c oxidase assembly protein subunit 15|nr:COX15/CtaA family protein [Bryobacteraceae bacterium]
MNQPLLHRYTILLAVCTLFLVVAGAAVTSKEAGLSVPDWPLSYGQVMPPMIGGVKFEHGHRMIATFVGMLTIGLAIWLQRVDSRSWMRKLGWISLAAVIGQGILGGLTVLLLLPPGVSIAHACLAQLFFSTMLAITVFTSKRWQEGPEMVDDHGWPSLRTLAIVAPVLVLAQVALGAAFRHRVLSVMPHVIGAMVVALALMLLGMFVLHQFPKHRSLRSAAHTMLGVTFLQVFLGIAAYFARLEAATKPLLMVLTTVAHVALGALTLATTIVLSIQIRRNVRAHSAVEREHAAVTS